MDYFSIAALDYFSVCTYNDYNITYPIANPMTTSLSLNTIVVNILPILCKWKYSNIAKSVIEDEIE